MASRLPLPKHREVNEDQESVNKRRRIGSSEDCPPVQLCAKPTIKSCASQPEAGPLTLTEDDIVGRPSAIAGPSTKRLILPGAGRAAVVSRPAASQSEAGPLQLSTRFTIGRPSAIAGPASKNGPQAVRGTAQSGPGAVTRRKPIAAQVARVAPKGMSSVRAPAKKMVVQHKSLQDRIKDKDQHIVNLEEEVTKLRQSQEQLLHDKEELSNSLRDKDQHVVNVEEELNKLRQSQEQLLHDKEELSNNLREHQRLAAEQFQVKEIELQVSQDKLDQALLKLSTTMETLNDVRNNNMDLKVQLAQMEIRRRVLHNTVQELKGNIRVFCRVRPPLKNESVVSTEITFPDKDNTVIELERPADGNPSETLKKASKHSFTFDRVFDCSVEQTEVFTELTQLVQSALDGYNVSVFAYGQTGSGKTYTMEGDLLKESWELSAGVIPRAVKQIFETMHQLESKGWNYNLSLSFIEIYNETVHDLLTPPTNEENLKIKMVSAESTEVMIPNLTTPLVKDIEEVYSLIRQAHKKRIVAQTNCNDRSSRSHSVFQLNITGTNSLVACEEFTSVLNLIDLAGSERIKQSGSTGARLKEATYINKSLSELGKVILALANKEKHIPYRNSKLTYLLQNCLGGNSKTLMFVNVSPSDDSYGETMNSLRFAHLVNNCNIGTATRTSKRTSKR